MKLVAIFAVSAIAFLSCGQITSAQELNEVKSDLAAVQSEIQAAKSEDARYDSGMIRVLIATRLATLRQTEAMLQQRLLSLKLNAPVRYTVDGKPFTLPAAAKQMQIDVESEIAASRAKIQQQEAEVARFGGGLAQAMSVATLETMRQTHAMLEQKWVSLRYGLPQYVGFAAASTREATISNHPLNSHETSASPDEGAPLS